MVVPLSQSIDSHQRFCKFGGSADASATQHIRFICLGLVEKTDIRAQRSLARANQPVWGKFNRGPEDLAGPAKWVMIVANVWRP